MKKEEIKLFKSRLKGMPEEEVNELVSVIAKFTESGFYPQEVFPEGIINPDAAKLKFLLTPEEHKKLIELLNENPAHPIFRDFKVFPLGIIRNEYYETQITLNGGR